MGFITAEDVLRIARGHARATTTASTCERLIEDETGRHEVHRPPSCPASSWSSPTCIATQRGFFLETYHAAQVRGRAAMPGPFVQDNHSRSVQGTLRGLHFQRRRPQGKLVRAVEGEMFDVAVDIRRGSPTFGRWVGVRLSGENFRQLYVPPGFAHGFCVLSDVVHVEYKCTDFYDAGRRGRRGLERPGRSGSMARSASPLLSAKDRAAPRLRDVRDRPPP